MIMVLVDKVCLKKEEKLKLAVCDITYDQTFLLS